MVLKTGLLGGSFDPVHLAHIALCRNAMDALELDDMQLLPAADPWQKEPLAASPPHRVEMLRLATRNDPNMAVNTMEIDRGGKTYTVDTIMSLPAGRDYYWILGADQLENFCTWRQWQDIVDRVQLAVAQRPGSELAPPAPLSEHLRSQGRELLTLPFEARDISSTDIRERLAQGRSVDGLLDEAVAQYIDRHGLYRQLGD